MIRFRRNNLFKFLFIVFFSFFGFKLILRDDDQSKSKKKFGEFKSLDKLNDLNIQINDNLYIQDISTHRLNKLFSILLHKENKYESVIKYLELISFSDFLYNKESSILFKNYPTESDYFLDSKDRSIEVNKNFVKYLYNKTQTYSFEHPRRKIFKSKINGKNKPVIVTAANSAYYSSLQATVFHIHQHLPDYPLIVYDLGLNEESYQTTVKNCKCKVIKFDNDGLYAKTSLHISNLKTYAWKPLIIQEALKEYESIIYVDSSIRFKSGEISPIITALNDVGMMTQFIELKLNCYTNPKMFEWFQDSEKSYEDFFTIEANILLFSRNFVTDLIMKAWITCALEENCIAPQGSSISGCCGCHRFDQDALTIVNSYFYGHPKESSKYLPAYSFTKEESYFFDIRRYEGMEYFKNI